MPLPNKRAGETPAQDIIMKKFIFPILIVILAAAMLPTNVSAVYLRDDPVRLRMLDNTVGADAAAVLTTDNMTCSETSYGGIRCYGDYTVTSTSGGIFGVPGYGYSNINYKRYDDQTIGQVYYRYRFTHENNGNGPNGDVTNNDYIGNAIDDGMYEGSVNVASTEVTFNYSSFSVGQWGNIVMHITEFIISPVPIPAGCDLPDITNVPEYEIDPTLEAGHENADLLIGAQYVLDVYGGPWNDGTDDLYITDVSWDGDEWMTINDFAQQAYVVCFESDATHPDLKKMIFIAQASTFYIRVSDTAGNFADNTPTDPLYYKLYITQSCPEFQFDPVDDLIINRTIPATSADYLAAGVDINGIEHRDKNGNLDDSYDLGGWYAITTAGGPWNDGSADRYDIAILGSDDTWHPLTLDDFYGARCETVSGSYRTVYFQADTDELHLRVNDELATFNNNTGDIDYSLYAVSFTRFPSTCEARFDIGDTIAAGTVAGNSDAGKPIREIELAMQNPLQGGTPGGTETRWFAIDTNAGPFLASQYPDVEYAWTTQIYDSRYEWEALEDYSEAACVVQLDQYHTRVYFQGYVGAGYKLAVLDPDGDYVENGREMGYIVRTAADGQTTEPGAVPEELACSGSYSYDNTPIVSVTIDGDDDDGKYLAFPTTGLYAIVTSAGPWNDGSADRYDIAVSDDGGETWNPLLDFDALRCAEQVNTDYAVVYLNAQAGHYYRVRVNDESSFGDNSGSITVTGYEATMEYDPWTSCDSDYELSGVSVADNNIPANLPNGTRVSPTLSIAPGEIFAIQTAGGPWYDGATTTEERYDIQITYDNGSTWYDFGSADDPNLLCTLYVFQDKNGNNMNKNGESLYKRVYFTAPANAIVRLRVNDDGPAGYPSAWSDNREGMWFMLYRGATDSNGNPTVIDPNVNNNTPGYNYSCSMSCSRPDAWYKIITIDFGDLGEIGLPVPDIGGWISYMICQVQYYFALCPSHIDAVVGLLDLMNQYEPFGTINEMRLLISSVVDEINSYTWTSPDEPVSVLAGDSGGGDGRHGWLPTLPKDSPWMGGPVEFNPNALDLGGGEGDYEWGACKNTLANMAGPYLSYGICAMFNITRVLGVLENIQYIWDLGMIVGLLFYINQRWLEKMGI